MLKLTLKEIGEGKVVVGQVTQTDVVVGVQHLGCEGTVYAQGQRLVGNSQGCGERNTYIK